MKKAYDRIDWQFLDKMSESRGFGVIFRNQVKSIPLCFTINDTNSSYFMAVKGLKQGDPLSLILFNLVADVFSKMLYKVARVDSALTRMGVCVFWTADLFLEIPASFGRWKDSFLSPLFIRISKQNGW
jgi:hypothetical protein